MGSGHITKYQINLDLIKIIQFCLNIYDLLDILDIFLDILLKPPQPLMGLFLGGLSLCLNHLIASHMTNYDWPFGTLPFELFGSNLATRDLETYPRT